MTKTKFIRLSGWAFILGAFAWTLGWATSNIQPYNPYSAFSRPIDKYLGYFYNSGEILVPSALILITLGILGLYLRYASLAGRLGKSGLAALKTRSLPRWNFTPVFTGLWFPLAILAGMIYQPLTGETLDSPWVLLPVFIFTGMGLFALGYLLQSDAPAEPLPAV